MAETERRRHKTPTVVFSFIALLALVGYQTVGLMGQLPSFDLVASGDGASAGAGTGSEPNLVAVRNLNLTTIRRAMRSTNKKITRIKIPLSELTKSNSTECLEPMFWLNNKEVTTEKRTQKIPLYIHQTSKSRCIHRAISRTTDSWRDLPMYEYYLHDDDAIWRLLNQDWPEFPHLLTIVRCLKSMTALSDVWRLLVLWEYGGIYSDLDAVPAINNSTGWTPSSILPEDEAYFVVENFDAPSQYFMAVEPHHPMIFYALHTAMTNIMAVPNTLKVDAAVVTGPFALLGGFFSFMRDVGQILGKPIKAGTYVGSRNRTVRLDGFGRKQSDDIIKREAITRTRKLKLYSEMNMTHFIDDFKAGRKTKLFGRSCYGIMYDIDIGPPDWFVPSEKEDRMTVGGYS
jgi:hypothetical protein